MGRKEEPLETTWMSEQDRRLTEVIVREESRLRNFIRKWVPEEADVEDVLQDVFFELVEAQRLMTPLREALPWMFRVARNRITDLFRRRGAESRRLPDQVRDLDDDVLALEEWLPARDAGPEAAYARRVLLEELDAALEELPVEQREVFVAHELEGRSFKELAEASGVPINTLLSRKHKAVLHLRKRLSTIYKEYVNV
jgi:RNA polymerase sigma factor (sigma-70 family)